MSSICTPVSLLDTTWADALGLALDDPRGLTVTGGLPYAGGPGSAYQLHAIASAFDRFRQRSGHALITGVGMHLAKHVAAVWSSTPGPTAPRAMRRCNPKSTRRSPAAPLLTTWTGPATCWPTPSRTAGTARPERAGCPRYRGWSGAGSRARTRLAHRRRVPRTRRHHRHGEHRRNAQRGALVRAACAVFEGARSANIAKID